MGSFPTLTKIFLQACRGEATAYTPIWLNRQAGRYMPEYHQVKGDLPSLEFFKNPERAARATLDAQRILGVDAAILFADLLPVLEPMGLELDYLPGEGPVFANPLRDAAAVDKLVNAPAEEATPYIAETVSNVLEELPRHREESCGCASVSAAPRQRLVDHRGSHLFFDFPDGAILVGEDGKILAIGPRAEVDGRARAPSRSRCRASPGEGRRPSSR